jgi:hypothetical protein
MALRSFVDRSNFELNVRHLSECERERFGRRSAHYALQEGGSTTKLSNRVVAIG